MARRTSVSPHVVRGVLDRDNYKCVYCGGSIAGAERGMDWSLHHRRARGMGGSRDPVANSHPNLVVLCGSGVTGCHGWVESQRSAARDLGYLVSWPRDPATVPIHVALTAAPHGTKPVRGLYLLTNDGTRTAVKHV